VRLFAGFFKIWNTLVGGGISHLLKLEFFCWAICIFGEATVALLALLLRLSSLIAVLLFLRMLLLSVLVDRWPFAKAHESLGEM
jgi:hypothetical protein